MYYGAALMLEAFMVMMLYVIIAKRKYPECKYTIVKKKTLYKELSLSPAGHSMELWQE